MTLTVHLFAAARDLLGQSQVEIELSEAVTVAELRSRLTLAYPKLQGLLARSAIAVNQDFAAEEALLTSADEVAVIPPVSGG